MSANYPDDPEFADVKMILESDKTDADKLESLALYFTQTSEDIFVAVQQWENERGALADLFWLSQEQDRLLTHLQGQWGKIRVCLFGAGNAGRPKVPEGKSLERFIDAAEKLDKWWRDVNDIGKQNAELKETHGLELKQLNLF